MATCKLCDKEAKLWFRGEDYCMDHGVEVTGKAYGRQNEP